MSKKAKIILAVSISATVLTASACAAAVIVCKRIYEKKYITAY